MVSKTVLITGGTGLVGSHLANQLAGRGHQVLVLSRSSRFSVPEAITQENQSRIELVCGEVDDISLLSEVIGRSQFIFHQAASVGASGAVESARDFIQNNISGTTSLVDVLRTTKHQITDVVLSSSVSVYGEGLYNCPNCGSVRPGLRYRFDKNQSPVNWNPLCPQCNGPISPVNTPETAEKHGESIYAVTKKMQEDLLVGTCRFLDINLSIFRLCTILGAGQSWHNPFTQFLESLLQGQAPVLHEDGRQSRDFIFVEDVVAANISLLEKNLTGLNIFNVGSGNAVALQDFSSTLALKMAEALNCKPAEPIIDDRFAPGDVRHCHTDCSAMKQVLNVQTTKSLEDGLDELVQWYVRKKHHPLV
jgi:dTDP-L-rhamnose 4-epimerase